MSGTPDLNAISTANELFSTQNRRNDAFLMLEEESARFPYRLDVIEHLGFLYGSHGRYRDALRLLNRVADSDPSPHIMSNILFCRVSIANCLLDGRPINGDGPAFGDV